MSTLVIPRPHVPHGPKDVPADQADANYLRAAARNIERSRCMGSNLTATVVKLLNDCAAALDLDRGPGLRECCWNGSHPGESCPAGPRTERSS